MKITETKDYETIAILNKGVQELHAELYPESFKEYEYEAIKEFFQKVIDKPEYKIFVLEDDGLFRGYAWIEIIDYPENAFKKAFQSIYIHQINVVKSERQKGYGSQLMEEIYKTAEQHRIKKIQLDYWVDNNIAKNFYKKIGFKKYREFVYKELY